MIIITGLPRSGSSWLRDIINNSRDTLIFNEPDTAPNGGIFEGLPFRIAIDQKNNDYTIKLTNALNKIKKLKFVNHGYDLLIIKKLLYYKLLSKQPEHIGFKSINANLKLGWICKELLYPKSIFIIRNPFGNIRSILEHEFYYQSNEDTIKKLKLRFLNNYFSKEVDRKLIENKNIYQLSAMIWKLVNQLVIQECSNNPNFKIIVFDELCKDTNRVRKEIFKFLNIEISHNNLFERKSNFLLHKLNNYLKRNIYKTNKESVKIASKWKNDLSDSEQNIIYDEIKDSALCNYFNLN